MQVLREVTAKPQLIRLTAQLQERLIHVQADSANVGPPADFGHHVKGAAVHEEARGASAPHGVRSVLARYATSFARIAPEFAKLCRLEAQNAIAIWSASDNGHQLRGEPRICACNFLQDSITLPNFCVTKNQVSSFLQQK